jgi:hypothetical protein
MPLIRTKVFDELIFSHVGWKRRWVTFCMIRNQRYLKPLIKQSRCWHLLFFLRAPLFQFGAGRGDADVHDVGFKDLAAQKRNLHHFAVLRGFALVLIKYKIP